MLYTPRTPSVDEVCRILSSGANVVTTAFAFHPARTDPADRDRLLAACQAGDSSLHGTGLNPGNLGAVVPLAHGRHVPRDFPGKRAGACRLVDVRQRRHHLRSDASSVPTRQRSPPTHRGLRYTSELFQQQVWLLGDALGADLDEVTTDLEVVPASADRDVFGRTLAAGTVAGQRWRWSGRRAGQTVIEVETLWVVGERQPAHWPTPQHGWTITIEGIALNCRPTSSPWPASCATFRLTEHVQSASVATAMQAVNAVAGGVRRTRGLCHDGRRCRLPGITMRRAHLTSPTGPPKKRSARPATRT